MSADRFDELTRALAGEHSRRKALKRLADWAVKAAAVALGVTAAGAATAQDVAASRNFEHGTCCRYSCPNRGIVSHFINKNAGTCIICKPPRGKCTSAGCTPNTPRSSC
jgi:hypothetical protein